MVKIFSTLFSSPYILHLSYNNPPFNSHDFHINRTKETYPVRLQPESKAHHSQSMVKYFTGLSLDIIIMWCIMRKYYKNNFWKYSTNLWLKTAISDSGHKTKDARTTCKKPYRYTYKMELMEVPFSFQMLFFQLTIILSYCNSRK